MELDNLDSLTQKLSEMEVPDTYRDFVAQLVTELPINDDIETCMRQQPELGYIVGYLAMCLADDIGKVERRIDAAKAMLYQQVSDLYAEEGRVRSTKDYINSAITNTFNENYYEEQNRLRSFRALKEFIYYLGKAVDHRENMLVQLSANARKSY